MATLTPQFYQLLATDKKTVFFDEYDSIPKLYPRLFDVRTSTTAWEDRVAVARLGTFVLKPEGTPISYDDPAQGTQVRTVHQTFGLGWRATKEMMQDDQHNVMDRMSADLADSAADHEERLAWGLINDAFTGTSYTGLEGDILFSATHTLLKGNIGTVNRTNILSPAVALSVTGLEAMMNLVSTAQSDEGRFIQVNPTILLVPPALQHAAHVLLNTEKRPGTADNDLNSVHSSRNGLSVLVSPYLTSPTNWYLFAAPGKNSLTWNNRQSLDLNTSQDSDTRDMKFTSTYRASVMFSDWRSSFGSQA